MNESTARLVAALEEANTDGRLDAIIVDARAEHFHDYDPASPHTFPEMALVQRLHACRENPNTRALAQRVVDGDFDATKAEADAWAASPEGQEAFRALIGGAPPPPAPS